MSRPLRGLQDGNTRSANIARWLNVPVPQECQELILYAWRMDEQPGPIARWKRAEVSRELAPEIDAMLEEYAADEQATCRGKLAWMIGEQEHCKKDFRILTNEKPSRVDQLDGTPIALVIQAQKFAEAAVQSNMEMMAATNKLVSGFEDRYARMFEVMDRQLARISDALDAALSQRELAEQSAAQAEALAEEATKTAEIALAEAEEAKKDDKIAKVIELGVKQLQGVQGT